MLSPVVKVAVCSRRAQDEAPKAQSTRCHKHRGSGESGGYGPPHLTKDIKTVVYQNR